MRTIRALTTALALAAVLPGLAAAQSIRPFNNSWFWGAKAGAIQFSTVSTTNALAPLGGAEWLITRTKAGLYVSYSQAFFDRTEYIQAEGDTTRAVNLSNLRRVEIAGMVFPGSSRFIKPYVGLGITMHQVASALPQGTYDNADQYFAADALITEFRTSITPLLLGGLQLQLPLASAFVQGSAAASQKNFFLHGTNAFNLALEGGLRFNFGSSIDRN
jgi:hypothetical protein